MRYRQNLLLGALLIVASELMFATMAASVKALSVGLPNEMVVFMRNAMGLLVLLPLLLRYRGQSLKTDIWHLHLLRSLLGLGAMYCFFYALAHLPLAEGMLLKMTSPLFMPLIAWWWLRESGSRYAFIALPIGFAGVILILRPEGEFSAVALVGLLGGLLAALAKVTVRRLGRSEPSFRIVFYFTLIATLVSAFPATAVWRTPDVDEWRLLLLMGVVGTLGQLLLTRGYAVAEAACIAPFTYFSVAFGALYGYLFWGELLDLPFIVGATLIVVAGLLVLRRRGGTRCGGTTEPVTES
ncbi:hypothetical protein BOW53_05835 [Solemya pervernicosa gill symbiont]|uniref:EamA domain-containing protein n=2 Tax=Gammaproteobacteria incertae sedis TaxID=118884 RepID=A0A1T2L7W1_9GAMM|nr:DMT family transporter [Candidatus Reidiella endopervernicosa]OOZ41036.1 hypothetical protein BOW53_05835 [Solemya pervernicosa gill symbiont]QKQ25099.1 DMT family transporter [Candidatus Reidiella endopervernicosa]